VATTTKTERTRSRLLAVALELFARQGYDATTVAQIAAAAGVTEMTFYRHFGSKDQVLINDPYDPLIALAIGEQPTDLPPLDRVIRGIRLAWRRLPITDDQPIRERIAIVADTPGLAAAMRAGTDATESAITGRLIADGTDRFEAQVAAAAAMTALMVGLMHWATGPGGSLSDAVERSLDVLERNHV
jgi:AcrR family transcriptional regulator